MVDDIAEQRGVARRMLETMGYRVAVAASGEDALGKSVRTELDRRAKAF